jgi:FkbM family methyltransferase
MPLVESEGFYYPETHYISDVHKWDHQRAFLPAAYPYVKRWGTCIDGGAFAGRWAKEYAEVFQRVVAFEPMEDQIRCIKWNAPTATIIPCGLSNKQGYRQFCIRGANYANIGDKGENKVWCTNIDAFDWHELGLIKLDVEGEELNALVGATNTIHKFRPVLVIEFKGDTNAIVNWLNSMKYMKVEANHVDQVWVCSKQSY